MNAQINKYLSEFIGTFFLVLTVGCTVIAGATGVLPPLAIASILMVMIYAGAHISGAHYNPAVTLGIWLRGRCRTEDVVPYMVSQFVGAVAAAFVVMFLKQEAITTIRQLMRERALQFALSINYPPALLAEFLFTFALVYVVLNVATSRATSGNSFYGLAIGFTVLAGAYAVGGISSAAFNPAVALAFPLWGLSTWVDLWIYFVANFSGAAAAAYVFNYLNPDDR